MGNDGNKKKVAMLGVSGLMLVVIGTAVTVGVTKKGSGSHGDGQDVSNTMKAIDSICQPTDYKETCVKALKESGTTSTDPKELIKAAFEATIKYVKEATGVSQTLKELEDDPMGVQALEICEKLFEYSIDDLNTSIERLGTIDLSKVDMALEDLNIWLSSASTLQVTCLDAFENVSGDAGAKMQDALKMSMELTSNALSMITEIKSLVGNLSITPSRRLLQLDADPLPILGHGELPNWMDPLKRKLLADPALKPDLIVAQDGSGKYKTVNEALKDIPLESPKPFVLYVKAGVYNEKITFDKKMINLVLIGDGPTKTKLTYNQGFTDGIKTSNTASVTVLGKDFMAKDIGFENSAGWSKHQAVAFLSKSDQSVFYNCQFDGYQDTLYAIAMRQFYRDCVITGTVDFIFGNAAAIFQNCKMLIRKPNAGQNNMVTAQGRDLEKSATGFVLQGCTITGDATMMPVKDQFQSYLGRPWKKYAKTIIMQTFIDNLINPQGWHIWDTEPNHETCYYAEYQNKGPGADTSKRVPWKTIHQLTAQEVQAYTTKVFLVNDTWITRHGIPYTEGMLPA